MYISKSRQAFTIKACVAAQRL